MYSVYAYFRLFLHMQDYICEFSADFFADSFTSSFITPNFFLEVPLALILNSFNLKGGQDDVQRKLFKENVCL